MGADKNSSRWRLKLQQDELARSDPRDHTLHTSTFRSPKPRRHWSANGPRRQILPATLTHTHPRQRKQLESRLSRGGRLDRVWGRLDRLHQATKNSSETPLTSTKTHHDFTNREAMLATRKSWRKPKLHPGALGRLDRLPGAV
jgi:hypothetical protein